MIVCAHCNSTIAENVQFCTQCGQNPFANGAFQKAEEQEQMPPKEKSFQRLFSSKAVKIATGVIATLILVASTVLLTGAGAMSWMIGERYTESELKQEYKRGKTAGFSDGSESGYNEGRADGYESGKLDGCLEFFDDVQSDSGYRTVIAWDTYWREARGTYYYSSASSC